MKDLGKKSVTRHQIGEEAGGQRIDNYLVKLLKGVPKSHVYRILRSGEVRVNGGRAKPDYRVKTGDELRIPPVRVAERPARATPPVSEVLVSNLLKSNCLVTSQPDWGSAQISYTGDAIDQEGLLQYLVSFRNHNEFHEQCVERIFMDIWTRCKPIKLSVYARYTRRGGLDINPFRTSHPQKPPANTRTARQ